MSDASFPLDGDTAFRPPDSARTVIADGHFAPGTLLADRYRIVAQLGKGGMGEVYRADDLKLGHSVALKFLPRHLAHDRGRLERLFGEVRIGRQVSHPHVCRLYDIVEWEGTHFISMEYVDGEDLASLIRRIGRLPMDKALEIARDLAAGLAAAHDLGVVHRDLKPANIMIDGRGRARITDFGLAALAEELEGTRGYAGTPQYMAPEQLRGEPATIRSDIYALGLILYEVFTGKRFFEGATLSEIQAQRSSRKTPSVSSVVRDADPAVERVIARCLDDDPLQRPPSAHAVIAALPGGDPLAAALAAGETPSPQMVAAAGEAGDLRPAVAWTGFAAAILTIVALALVSNVSMVYRLVPMTKSPEVLQAKARDIAALGGYYTNAEPADTAGEWTYERDYLSWLTTRGSRDDLVKRMREARPGALTYLARFHNRPLQPWREDSRIVSDDPPLVEPGMTSVMLDSSARLVLFFSVPDERVERTAQVKAFDWTPFFKASGLDPARFHPATWNWTAPVESDQHLAWDGTFAEQPDVTIRVEAASLNGRPVAYGVVGPWMKPQLMTPRAVPMSQKLAEAANLAVNVAAFGVGIVLAVRNLRRGRGDRKGAFRVAAACFVLMLAALLVRADFHGFDLISFHIVEQAVGKALYYAARTWLLYVALEPYVRRKWPRVLISWSRLLAGRWRDPMIGRDLLAGTLLGLLMTFIARASTFWPRWLGWRPDNPQQPITSAFGSARHVLFFIFRSFPEYVFPTIALVALIVILRVMLRKHVLAIAVAFALVCLTSLGGDADWRAQAIEAVLVAVFVLGALLRFGIVGLTSLGVVWSLNGMPLTLDTTAWYFGRSFVTLIFLAALALAGAVIALGDKPLFGTPLFDES